MYYKNVNSSKESVKSALNRQAWTVVCVRAQRMIESNHAKQIAIYVTNDFHFNQRRHTKSLAEFNEPYLEADIIGATAPRRNHNVSPSYIWAFVR